MPIRNFRSTGFGIARLAGEVVPRLGMGFGNRGGIVMHARSVGVDFGAYETYGFAIVMTERQAIKRMYA